MRCLIVYKNYLINEQLRKIMILRLFQTTNFINHCVANGLRWESDLWSYLTLEAFAGAAAKSVTVAVVNGMIDLFNGGRAGRHAALAQLHQLSHWLHLDV